jgi:hypothetical protein
MSTERDAQIVVRIAGVLRQELAEEAALDGRSLSGLIRKVLVDHAVTRSQARVEQERGRAAA